MSEVFVLDACALIAALSKEEGGYTVLEVYNKANIGQVRLVMNKINLLEVYYDDYRVHDKTSADNMFSQVCSSAVQIITEISDDIFKEAGRLKASHKISLADSIVLAQALVTNGILLTSDHHEFETIEKSENIRIQWIR